jgi:hypothetical protein
MLPPLDHSSQGKIREQKSKGIHAIETVSIEGTREGRHRCGLRIK